MQSLFQLARDCLDPSLQIVVDLLLSAGYVGRVNTLTLCFHHPTDAKNLGTVYIYLDEQIFSNALGVDGDAVLYTSWTASSAAGTVDVKLMSGKLHGTYLP